MAKEIMRRTAADNVYLHKDFHGALSNGIGYLEQRYGEDAVRDYLRQFTLSYYAPLRADLGRRGLVALKEHFEKIFAIEGAPLVAKLTDDELVLTIDSCPAVAHMRKAGQPVSRLFRETSRAVNEALCEGTPFAAELVSYRDEDGASVQRFYRTTA
jgi:hypothetical protein